MSSSPKDWVSKAVSLRVQAKAALLVTQAQAMLAMPVAWVVVVVGASKALIDPELPRA